MGSASIILADDNILVRKFLRMLIQIDPNLCVVNEAGDGLELLGQLEETIPDIVILDLSMPNLSGLETAEIIKKKYPHVKLVILTLHQEHSYFRRAQRLGVEGYVLKEEIENMCHIITKVLQGKTYMSHYFQRKVDF